MFTPPNQPFMSSAGHILDMIARMKNNSQSKKSHRERRKEIQEAYLNGHHTAEQNQIREKVISRENLEKIKQKIRIKLSHESRLSTILTVVFTFLSAILLVFIVYHLLSSFYE